jgi:hypothetical protein
VAALPAPGLTPLGAVRVTPDVPQAPGPPAEAVALRAMVTTPAPGPTLAEELHSPCLPSASDPRSMAPL